MKRHIVHALVLLTIAFLASCGESGELNTLFLEADELMNTRPDSALCLLEEVRPEVASCPRSQRMRHELLVAKAMNKAYVDFTTDSIMLTVTDYYDHHGTPNERMLAHYLLGCTYRDLGEAPRTLECYKDAVACADTLSTDCDYRTMMSIYGQIATLYDKQAMPMEELNALECSGWNALKCRDTITYIRSIELQVRAYNLLGDTAKIFETTKKAYQLFMDRNLPDYASQTLPIAIVKHLRHEHYDEAKKLMDIFEANSGFFTESGEIDPQRSHYYNSKGLYYLGISQLDSAEYFFKKLLAHGHGYDATKGLIRVYDEQNKHDSVSKYVKEFEGYQNSYMSSISQESVRQTEAMYDYARNQRIAYEEKMKREKTHRALLSVAFLFMLTVIAGSLLYRRKAKEKAREISRVANQYLNASSLYERAKGEMEQMELNHVAYQQAKQAELDELRDTMERYRIDYDQLKLAEKRAGLEQSDVVTLFRDMAQMKAGNKVPSKSDWNELQRVVSQACPDLYAKIAGGGILSEQELQICLLTSLGFSNSDQTILLNVVPQRITNAKRRIGEKLFSDPSARSLEAHLSAI